MFHVNVNTFASGQSTLSQQSVCVCVCGSLFFFFFYPSIHPSRKKQRFSILIRCYKWWCWYGSDNFFSVSISNKLNEEEKKTIFVLVNKKKKKKYVSNIFGLIYILIIKNRLNDDIMIHGYIYKECGWRKVMTFFSLYPQHIYSVYYLCDKVI